MGSNPIGPAKKTRLFPLFGLISNLKKIIIGLTMTPELKLSERDHQIHEAVRQAVDVIDAAAVRTPRTSTAVALELLRQDKVPFVNKAAAIFVRTRELIKQNPPRSRR